MTLSAGRSHGGRRLQGRARLPGMGMKQTRCYIIKAAALYPDAQAKQAA